RMKISELKQDDIYNRLETWSQVVIDILE
ncbi:hypothetical protein MOC30_21045, partial [Bacillus spizizenii]|nr:hypothetical protein [Bacillus spizizenii]